MLDVFLVVLHALNVVLVLLEYFSLVEIKATFAELAVTLLYVSVRCEEHQDSSLYALVQLEEEAAKVPERLLHVLVLKVELEIAAHKVRGDDRGKHL